MKIILRKDVQNLGKSGEVKEVSRGYGRNYLLPRGLAYLATDNNLKAIEEEKKRVISRREKEKKEMQALAKKIQTISCTITRISEQENRVFGSVSNSDIAQALSEKGIAIDKKKIDLPEPIKEFGVYNVPIRLYAEVIINLKVWVIKALKNNENVG